MNPKDLPLHQRQRAPGWERKQKLGKKALIRAEVLGTHKLKQEELDNALTALSIQIEDLQRKKQDLGAALLLIQQCNSTLGNANETLPQNRNARQVEQTSRKAKP